MSPCKRGFVLDTDSRTMGNEANQYLELLWIADLSSGNRIARERSAGNHQLFLPHLEMVQTEAKRQRLG